MSIKKKISLIVIIFILIFASIEISLRIIARLNKKTLFSALTIDDSVLDWRLLPNYRDEKAGIYVNSLGFRGKEFKQEKEKGTFRIIAIGDSCTFGVGAEGTTYPEIIEKKLNTSNTKYEVINAGVPGYTSSQAFLYTQRELAGYKPDLILVYIGWNDIWTYKNPGANTAYSPGLRKMSRILSKSLTFTLLRNYFINPTKGKICPAKEVGRRDFISGDKFREKADNFKEGLSKIIHIAKTNNFRVMLFTLPTAIREGMKEGDAKKFALASTWSDGYGVFLKMYAQLNEIIKNVGINEKVEIADLDLIFRQLPIEDAESIFSDAVHPNEKGLALIAQYVSQKILNKEQ